MKSVLNFQFEDIKISITLGRFWIWCDCKSWIYMKVLYEKFGLHKKSQMWWSDEILRLYLTGFK